MSGKPNDLAHLSTRTLPKQSDRALYQDVVLWLLTHQFIVSPVLDDEFYRVVQGSGMGLQISGPVSDLSFLEVAERVWATCPRIMGAHGIRHYVRFKDDIFVIASDRTLTRTWYAQFRKLASSLFALHVEQVSNACVRMLAVDVYIQGSRLRTRPKPPQPGIPLGLDSAHHPSILSGWPKSCLSSIRRLCTPRGH